MGQGLHTKMVQVPATVKGPDADLGGPPGEAQTNVSLCLQVASRVLDIPCSKIHISETSTNTVPNTSATAASASSDLNGAAVKNACEVLMKRLAPYKSQNPEGSWEDWVSVTRIN